MGLLCWYVHHFRSIAILQENAAIFLDVSGMPLSAGICVSCCHPSVAHEVMTAFVYDYGQAVQDLAEAAGYMLGVGQVLWQVGCALSDQGLWAEAEAPLRRSLQVLESQLCSDHLDLACVCNGAPSHQYLYLIWL